MAIGPGKFDDECTRVRQATNAKACIVIVLGAPDGSGMSCQCEEGLALHIPSILRDVANEIEHSTHRYDA